MKSLVLLFQQASFVNPQRPEAPFSTQAFEEECRRQGIANDAEVFLQVLFHTSRFVIIPKDIDAEAIFRHHFPQCDWQQMACLPLCDNLQNMMYEKDPMLEKAAQVLPHRQLLPDAYLLCNYLLHLSRKKDVMLVHWLHDDLQIMVARNAQLCFANSFKVKTQEEVLYYMAAILSEYGLCKQALVIGNEQLPKLIKEHFGKIETMSLAQEVYNLLDYQHLSL